MSINAFLIQLCYINTLQFHHLQIYCFEIGVLSPLIEVLAESFCILCFSVQSLFIQPYSYLDRDFSSCEISVWNSWLGIFSLWGLSMIELSVWPHSCALKGAADTKFTICVPLILNIVICQFYSKYWPNSVWEGKWRRRTKTDQWLIISGLIWTNTIHRVLASYTGNIVNPSDIVGPSKRV